jgi:outer membrane protein OmpA-like peptidoglycan-associated protein
MMNTRTTTHLLIAAALVTSGCSATRPAPPAKCAAIGALAGGASGAVIGGVWENDDNAEHAVAGLAAGVAAGALIGYGICAMMPERQMMAEAAPPPAPAPIVKKKIVLPGVSFALNKASLSDEATMIIDTEVIPVLREDSDHTVRVEGFTDSSGAEAYNQKLSERRAQTVEEHLAAAGIDRSRIEVVGMGESHPIASNDTPEGRAKNRRVEIKVIDN